LGALKGLIWRSDATRSQHRGLDCFITKNLPEMGQDRAGRIIHHLLWQHPPDGRSIAWGSSSYNTEEVWEVATNRRAYIFSGPRKDNADGVAWSPDGKYLISAISWSPDGTYLAFGSAGAVVVRETAQWSSSYAISGPVQMVNTVAWSPDSKRIASAGYLDPRVQVWDATDGEHVYIYGGHSIGVRSLAWSPDGKRIASGGIDQTVQVWEPVSSDEKTIAF
jgi:eukaryotic-like serine/threonine-protein kinase